VCLFGSLENTADYVGGSDRPWKDGRPLQLGRLLLYIRSRGTINNSQWDDPESLAVKP